MDVSAPSRTRSREKALSQMVQLAFQQDGPTFFLGNTGDVHYSPPRRGSLAVQRLQVLGEFRQVGGTDNDAVFDDLFAVEPERLL